MAVQKLGSHWRKVAEPIVFEVFKAHKKLSEKDLRIALYKAYPFPERRDVPFKVWNDLINECMEKRNRRIKRQSPQREPQQISLL